MTETVECVVIKCDRCGEIFEDYNGYSIFTLKSDPDLAAYDWHVDKDGDHHYCPNCHTVDDDDNVIIKPRPPRVKG